MTTDRFHKKLHYLTILTFCKTLFLSDVVSFLYITTASFWRYYLFFLRFRLIYYLFLILFYCFCIMFLCFFLYIYFFVIFVHVSFQKIIYIILHSKKGVLMPQIFILQHHTLLCFPLQHVSLCSRITTDSFIFPGTVFFAILFHVLIPFARIFYFTEAYAYESLCDKRKVPARIHFKFHTVTMTAVCQLFYECTAAGTVK